MSKSLSGFGKSAVNLIKGNTSGAKQIFNNSKKVLRNGAKYYFSQVRTQSVKEGLSKKTVGGIFKASIPGAIKVCMTHFQAIKYVLFYFYLLLIDIFIS